MEPEPLDEPLLLPGEVDEPLEPEPLGDVELPDAPLPLFIADSNSVRLRRPSASVSAALKSRPETPDASLEST